MRKYITNCRNTMKDYCGQIHCKISYKRQRLDRSGNTRKTKLPLLDAPYPANVLYCLTKSPPEHISTE